VKKVKIFNFSFIFLFLIFAFCIYSFAQQSQDLNKESAQPTDQAQKAKTENPVQETVAPEVVQQPETKKQPFIAQSLTASDNVTLDFKEADIQNVLKIISFKSGINIVNTPDVMGNVTIKLVDVPWETALDVLLKTYGFGYQRQGNIILVTKLENISKIQAEEVLQTEIFNLKFLDAQDAQKILIPLLSPRGKISVLYTRGQKGWKFGTFKIGREETKGAGLQKEAEGQVKSETISIEKSATGELVSKKAEFEPAIKSKTLIITDTAASLDRVRNVILPQIDKKPKQVLIEARIMEVSRDKLKDLGIDWGTGTAGASTFTTAPSDIGLNAQNSKTLAGRSLASEFTPNSFSPKEGITTFPGTYPYKAGLELLFKKFGGTQFEIVLHALEEDAHTNTLSSPRILTLDNQEASILVGFHTPILSSTVTAGSNTEGPTQVQTLDYYQEIGIRLNVVPQISEEGFINMIIHPSVTSTSSNVTATNVAGTGTGAITSTVNYPVIDVREAQTQVLMKDGETIVIGGLLKDIKSKQTIGIPFLSKIPILGNLFTRQTDDVSKIDLLIFISARVLKEGELSPEEIATLEQQLGKEQADKKEIAAKKKKR